MNCLLTIFGCHISLPHELLQDFISLHINKFHNTSDEFPFFSLEQKMLYNSILDTINEKYKLNCELLTLNEAEIKIKDIHAFSDILRACIKKARFALFLNKGHIIDNLFYFDYFIPTMKIGFFIYSDLNLFENKNYHEKINESFKILKETLWRKYEIELIFVEETYLLNLK